MSPIITDDRPIQSVVILPEGVCFEIGVNVGSIRAYGENGEMAEVPWVEIRDLNGVVSRVAARWCFITYQAPMRNG